MGILGFISIREYKDKRMCGYRNVTESDIDAFFQSDSKISNDDQTFQEKYCQKRNKAVNCKI